MSKRGVNCSTYKWHIYGTLCGNAIDKKYFTVNEFVEEYRGDKTCLNLNKSKVIRLKKKWLPHQKRKQYMPNPSDEMFQKNWGLIFQPIHEKRKCTFKKIIVE